VPFFNLRLVLLFIIMLVLIILFLHVSAVAHLGG
jgi:hypothetical protein